MKLVSIASLTVFGLAALSGCGDDTNGPSGGEGTVTFTSWGEEYIEDQIPSSAFEDGYSVTYDRFLVLVGNIVVADSEGVEAGRHDGFFLMDHTEPGTKELISLEGLEAKAWTHVSYETSPASAGQIEPLGAVTQADVDQMVTEGLHVYVEGTISNGTASKTFAWGFGVPTLLDDCEGDLDGKTTEGVLVTQGGNDVVELTIHGDHFFYDDLQAAEAVLRADAMFNADADDDGEITLEELEAVSLVDLPPDQYGTGGVDGVNDLRAFVEFLSRTLGHFRGEGECFLATPE